MLSLLFKVQQKQVVWLRMLGCYCWEHEATSQSALPQEVHSSSDVQSRSESPPLRLAHSKASHLDRLGGSNWRPSWVLESIFRSYRLRTCSLLRSCSTSGTASSRTTARATTPKCASTRLPSTKSEPMAPCSGWRQGRQQTPFSTCGCRLQTGAVLAQMW